MTLSDLAREAGISRSGVSRALNNDPLMAEETRHRVQAIAQRLGYERNQQISRAFHLLREAESPQAKVRRLLFFCPLDAEALKRHHTLRLQWKVARARARQLGYTLELADPRTNKPPHLPTEASALGGFIPFFAFHPPPFALQSSEDPCVSANPIDHFEVAVPRVIPDLFRNVTLALEHLKVRGFHRVGFIAPQDLADPVFASMQAAYLSFQLEEKGSAPIPPLRLLSAEDTPLPLWIRKHRPDVVLGTSPEIFSILQRRRILEDFPDLGFVSACDRILGSTGAPPGALAHVSLNLPHIAQTCIDLLVATIQRRELGYSDGPDTTIVNIPGTWREGKSLKTLPR